MSSTFFYANENSYGSHLGDPDYRPEYDLEPPSFGDGDIDIYDVVIAAANYGKSC